MSKKHPRIIVAQQAHDMMQKDPSVLLVCAYDKDEDFRQNDLEGAISLDEFRRRKDSLPKDENIIFYCACPHDEGRDKSSPEVLPRRLHQLANSRRRCEYLARSGLWSGWNPCVSPASRLGEARQYAKARQDGRSIEPDSVSVFRANRIRRGLAPSAERRLVAKPAAQPSFAPPHREAREPGTAIGQVNLATRKCDRALSRCTHH